MRFATASALLISATIAAVLAASTAVPVFAGQPVDWQMGFQPAATSVMENIHAFHNFLLWIIAAICLFVLALLIIVMVRFNARVNPTPSKTTHNTLIEVVWTVVPVIILIVIAIPSFRLLYYEQTIPETEMTIKSTGHQWYWSYEYPDEELAFDQIMLDGDDLEARRQRTGDAPRLLASDNPIVIPVDTTVSLIVTASDVIHAWAIPAFGIKIDAIPGRLNEVWFRPEREGVYYGQCSELCGMGHAFMPIEVRVVSQEVYDEWLEAAQTNGMSEANEVLFARIYGEAEQLAADAGTEAGN